MAARLASGPSTGPPRIALPHRFAGVLQCAGQGHAGRSHLPAEVDAHVHEGQRLGCRRRRDFHVVHAGHEVACKELIVSRLHLRCATDVSRLQS